SELICAAECGEHIEPYKLGNIVWVYLSHGLF
ncbi:TPA: DUF4754 family protein, partial [Escherichia coli]|nr:DUF4754 family protein [Escherichia coli]